MEKDEAITLPGLYQEERGAGGKFRKPPPRKRPTTPYARPANQNTYTFQKREGGWLSKLLDPASRLLSGGATRFFPSLFSRTPAVIASPTPSETEDSGVKQDAGEEDPKPNSEVGPGTLLSPPSKSILVSVSKEGGSTDEVHRSKCVSQVGHVRDKLGTSSDGSQLSEIEQLMKGKTFSRDELNHLMEILHSRVIDHSDVNGREEKNRKVSASPNAAGDVFAQEKVRTSVQEKEVDILSGVMGGVTKPIFQPTIRNEAGSSPVEIAKAYMGARALESSLSCQSRIQTDERTPVHRDDFASRRSVLLSSPNSSLRHPGAVVQDQSGYLTPQTQRGRIGLHDFPRTPYSRTVYPRSTSKMTPFQGVCDSSRNILSTHNKQLQTPVYGGRQTRAEILDDGLGSVGPIRRIRQAVSTTPSRVAGSPYRASSRPLWTEDSDASTFPTFKRNLDPGASSNSSSAFQHGDSKAPSFNVGVTTVHPQSSELARKILEHLDRTVPTPKEKSTELELAMAWKKPPSEFTTGRPYEQFGRPHVEGSDAQKSSNLLGENFSGQGNEDRGRYFSVDSKTYHPSQTKTHEVSRGLEDGGHSEKDQPFPLHNQMDRPNVPKLVRVAAVSDRFTSQTKAPNQSSGAKWGLTSISINKPDPKRAVFFDNGAGFTFPVSATSGAFSEPPTPSIMPSSSAISLPQLGGNTAPLYSFGAKRSNDQILVFSFPSTSTSIPTHDDSSTPKFTFGSDKKKPEVSFRSLGKDTICC
ncbi:hypothetical protein NE237_030876 [Protea cynaroides]|uniref:Nuclear pore complex protein NUP1 n=1 Tax=Protea cynaroides TaxID=273540 RepID=A0A9Q0GUY6_9MAGN|nr:hypothetical protein NE237_030876 [Protea cynaroides]